MKDLYGWLAEATPEQRRTLTAAALGWMLDSMDVMLYALVLGEVQKEMHLSNAASGAMVSATLLAGAVGGIGFGWFADRFGRTRALTWSILIYSVATALCGFTQTPLQLLLCRLLLGLGMGGEWASGAALVAETWPDRHRGKALALVQSAWAIGYGLAAAIVAIVMPRFGWRAVFFAGIIPALVTLWMRRNLHESAAWESARSNPQSADPESGVRRAKTTGVRRSLVICATMNAATLFGWWGLFTWVPHFLSQPVGLGGRGMNIVQTSGFTIAMQAGAFLGYVLFGFMADRYSPKLVYIGYLLIAAILTPVFALVRASSALFILGPLVGFFGTGYFSGFSLIASELFTTRVRGLAMGVAYNSGRIVSAAAPYFIGWLSQRAGLNYALCATAAGFLVAALIATSLRLPAASHSLAS